MKIVSVFFLVLFFSSSLFSVPPCYENIQGDWARATLQSLTLREKIGQLFMVATISSSEQSEEALASSLLKCPYKMDTEYIKYLIEEYKVGGLIFLYKSTPDKQIDAINYYQSLSKTPLLIGQDCEWGLSMRLYDTMQFPYNKALGALKDKKLIYDMGFEIGKQCKAVGVHINFSPVVDVNTNPNNPVIGKRSFGDTPNLVGECGLLMMQGLQDAGTLACAKHFPGHGDTNVDSHFLLPVIYHSFERLKNVELVPFRHLIDGGVAAVMSAHLAMPMMELENELPSSMSYAIVTQLLEHDLHFNGLKITDGLGMQAITNNYAHGEIELKAFLAGNDILLCPLDVPKAVELIEHAVKDDKNLLDDLEKRVLKILKAKEWAQCQSRKSLDKEVAARAIFNPQALELQKKLYLDIEI
jgi:beta-glucosidase-like glycosyl hydrolase